MLPPKILALVLSVALVGCETPEKAHERGYDEGFDDGYEVGYEKGQQEVIECVEYAGGSAEDAAYECS